MQNMEKKSSHNTAYVMVQENVGMLIKQSMAPHGSLMTQEEQKIKIILVLE